MDLYNLKDLNNALVEQKRLLFSQGFFYSDSEKNGEFALMQKLLPHFDAFIDIGANIGNVSELAHSINSALTFHLFDVLPADRIKTFSETMTYYQKIMSETAGETLTIYSIPEDRPFDTTEVSSVYKRTDYNVKNQDLVAKEFETETLDNFASNFRKDDKVFLKIDTEGSEIPILNGAKSFFKDYNVYGYLEYNPTAWALGGHSYKDLYRYLLEIDYSIFRITPLGLKEISYYHEMNESLFCYYFFAPKGAIDEFGFDIGQVERKTGVNTSNIHLF